MSAPAPTPLTDADHWSDRYAARSSGIGAWQPRSYDSQVLAAALARALAVAQPRSILEVGCGNSSWLPYLAKAAGATATGIDYSPRGCELARQRLAAAGVAGTIHCADVFALAPEEVGHFDLVFSLGVVEHFAELPAAIGGLLRFVRPGGVLFTEVPNLRSLHGVLSWAWQPGVLARHRAVSLGGLVRAHREAGVEVVRAGRCGLFSPTVVAWGVYPRWPRLERALMPLIRRSVRGVDALLRRLGGREASLPGLSPFLYVIGRRSLPRSASE